MRTAIIKKQVEEYYAFLKPEYQRVSVNGSNYQKIMNWKDINKSLHYLNEYKFIGDSVKNIFDMGENFIASTETTAILESNFNNFNIAFNIVKAKCEAIINAEYANDKIENDKDSIYIKLPNDLKELSELTSIVKGLDTTFNHCPILRETYSKANFEGVDVGSSWLIISFVLAGAPIAGKTLNWIADFIKKCNDIRIQNRTIKKIDLEMLLEKSKLDNEQKENIINDINEKMKEENREKCIQCFKSISIPFDREITSEEESKITHCMITLSELLDMGVEIYPSVEAPDELKLAFPQKEEWKKISGDIKQLDESKV